MAQVLCDLGTDCSDCGPWTYHVPKSLADGLNNGPPIRPVQQLVKRGLQVYTRRTTTVPSFIMPYTNWKHDVDVSEQMEHAGAVEQGLTQVCHGDGLPRFESRHFVRPLAITFLFLPRFGLPLPCVPLLPRPNFFLVSRFVSFAALLWG